jgi:hypothetical protein
VQPAVDVRSISLDATNASYLDKAGVSHTVPLEALSEIKYLAPGSPRVRGFFEGAGIGFLSGAVVGFAVGYAGRGNDCNNCIQIISPALAVALVTAAGGILGIVTGGIIGAVRGHRESLEPGPKPAPEVPPQSCLLPPCS